jgi:uncharacterized protein YjbI with pentapeptide repeats
LSGAVLEDIHFDGVNLERRSFFDCEIKRCSFTNCNLTSLSFSKARVFQTNFAETKLDHASFQQATFDRCNFHNCQMQNIDLRWTYIYDSNLRCISGQHKYNWLATEQSFAFGCICLPLVEWTPEVIQRLCEDHDISQLAFLNKLVPFLKEYFA